MKTSVSSLAPRALVAGLLCAFAAAPVASAAELIVPLYKYPSATDPLWVGVKTAAATNPVTAIVNPADGPGASVDPTYTTNIATLNTNGVTLAGYIYTLYGTRPLIDVYADIDQWGVLYPTVTQIFIDEQSDNLADVAYYQSIYSYVALKGYTRVFTNPGTQVDVAFTTSTSIPVTSMLYEDRPAGWTSYVTPSYVASRPASDFAVIVYNCATSAAMSTAVTQAKARNFGYIYVTDDKGANPYDKIPTYWTAEKAAVYP